MCLGNSWLSPDLSGKDLKNLTTKPHCITALVLSVHFYVPEKKERVQATLPDLRDVSALKANIETKINLQSGRVACARS